MFIFNQIPKTGRTSMYRVIEHLVGPGRITPHLSVHEDITYRFDASDFQQYRVIYGHIGTAWNDVLRPGCKWMTILRNPVDRVLSQYYFWRNAIPPSPHLSY